MIKSPLRYPGGKAKAVNYLTRFTPEYDEMREVFFGGGSLMFHNLQLNFNKKYAASDLNYELFSFWSQLKDNSNELILLIQNIYDVFKLNQTDTYKKGKELFKLLVDRRDSNTTELQRAVDFFILNRITFSGVVDSGGFSHASFNSRFTQSSIKRLKDIVPLLSFIDFYCEDYSYLLRKPGRNVFVFLDPPYFSATKSKLYGRKGILHTNFNHINLHKELSQTKHKWLITYDNSEYIRDLYKEYYQIEWKLQYGMTNRNNATSRVGNEILISNYDLNSILKTNEDRQLKLNLF
jgi:DNA adenine methylase